MEKMKKIGSFTQFLHNGNDIVSSQPKTIISTQKFFDEQLKHAPTCDDTTIKFLSSSPKNIDNPVVNTLDTGLLFPKKSKKKQEKIELNTECTDQSSINIKREEMTTRVTYPINNSGESNGNRNKSDVHIPQPPVQEKETYSGVAKFNIQKGDVKTQNHKDVEHVTSKKSSPQNSVLLQNSTIVPDTVINIPPSVQPVQESTTVVPEIKPQNEHTITPAERLVTYESVIHDLGVLSNLEPNYKLRLVDGRIAIDDRYLQPLQRALSGDDRTSTIDYIKQLIIDSESFKNDLIKEINKISNGLTVAELSTSTVYRDLKFKLKELIERLKSADTGLKNLKSTYQYDINIRISFDEFAKSINKIYDDANKDSPLN